VVLVPGPVVQALVLAPVPVREQAMREPAVREPAVVLVLVLGPALVPVLAPARAPPRRAVGILPRPGQ
jgi:hypothetical protein